MVAERGARQDGVERGTVSLPARDTATGEFLAGDLAGLDNRDGLVVFVHGSGSSRHSPRNRAVAAGLNRAGFATLLMDLLTPTEHASDERTGRLRFDIELLTVRVLGVLDWVAEHPGLRDRRLGLFGASTGAAAALGAAVRRPGRVSAVVSRGGRPDLAVDRPELVRVPTLLVVGARDREVLELNERVAARIAADNEVHRVPGATHLFEEEGALEQVARAAGAWFAHYLAEPTATSS
ncbi:dienelactone hydrolase family protein [Actinopolyspora mortivallis]|uniref:Alpha/beta hydrolase n=1 Tax=Actinopolyspora mortivallis TaxID=33906 RepID=A0A2T0H152_ACTMO|nr:alpha/beta fold hydrolase [Actinopolyspora mortivallis]PRW65099.1 alpha/beta hydrolase [Actinopolyspora mortivallis]